MSENKKVKDPDKQLRLVWGTQRGKCSSDIYRYNVKTRIRTLLESMTWEKNIHKPLINNILIRIQFSPLDLACCSSTDLGRFLPIW